MVHSSRGEPHRRRILISKLTVPVLVVLFLACGGGSSSGPGGSEKPSYSLSGSISAPSNASVDWDVNDANASNHNGSNNSLESTQPLASPVSLAGYVKLSGDASDYFSISLDDDQTVTLYIADPDNADIDLYLYNDLGEIQDSAMGDGSIETLQITSDGDYILEVRIVESDNNQSSDEPGSNYILVIDAGASAIAGHRGMRLNDDFVSGEVIVCFKDENFSTARGSSSRSRFKAADLGMRRAAGEAGRPMRLLFDSQADAPAVFNSLGLSSRAMKRSAAIADDARRGKMRTLEVVKALRQRKDVLYAEPNYYRRVLVVPDDTYYKFQWHYDKIHLPEAWDITTGSEQVIVAVVDTGVLVNHPDLADKLTGTGYDFVSEEDLTGDGDGIDDDPDDPGDKANADNSSTFHGTHVAGTISAATGNNSGVAGAGWQTRVMALRGLGLNGLGTDYDIAQCIRYAAGLSNDSGTVVDDPADIINMSVGSSVDSKTLSDAIEDAAQQGVIIIAAAGNESDDKPVYPAAYDSVVSVSAVDYAGNLAYYSNFGDTIDVAAPGGDASADLNADGVGDGILSTLGSDVSGDIEMAYGFYQGTSMATPHVAGVVALMKALNPDLTPEDLDALLAGGEITTDIGKAEFFGAGLIDAQKAVLAAQSETLPTLLRVNPSLLSLGAALSGVTITAEKIGDTGGELSVDEFRSDADWLTITPDDTDSDGLGTYTVAVDRSDLADGPHFGTIIFVGSTNTVTVSVTIQVGTPANQADTGFLYVRLIDAVTSEVAYQDGVRAQNGVYDFLFANVIQGDYFLFAGTDLDKDGRIAEAGELVGAYLSLDQPRQITVDRHRSELDFKSRHNIQIGQTDSAFPNLMGMPISPDEK